MYNQYWNFGHPPFQKTGDLPQNPGFEEALARLEFVIENSRRVGLVLGGQGCGKTHLLQVFGVYLRKQCWRQAAVNLRTLDTRGFLWLLAAGLGVNPADDAAEFALSRAIDDQLSANQHQQIHTVFLLDDADRARPEVLEQLVRFASSGEVSHERLSIVLAVQDSAAHRLGGELLELAELRIDLTPWEAEDTQAFLEQSMRQAGRADAAFSPDAVQRLHQLANGSPRRVTQLAELSLLAGAGKELERVDEETVVSAYAELGAPLGG